jgi:hypothetical protein
MMDGINALDSLGPMFFHPIPSCSLVTRRRRINLDREEIGFCRGNERTVQDAMRNRLLFISHSTRPHGNGDTILTFISYSLPLLRQLYILVFSSLLFFKKEVTFQEKGPKLVVVSGHPIFLHFVNIS